MDKEGLRTVTMVDVLRRVEGNNSLQHVRKRDLVSAVNRVCAMAGETPATVFTEVAALRSMVNGIRPALHDVSDKTWSNLRSNFVAALEIGHVIVSTGRGEAGRDCVWGPLIETIKQDRRMSCGLAAFANYCVRNGIAPDQVSDGVVASFATWLEIYTLTPKPNDVARRVPNIWNAAAANVLGWPAITLLRMSTRPAPKRVPWNALPEAFRHEAEAYLAKRANPDVFDENTNMPTRALAPGTVRLQREQLHTAASVLTKSGVGAVSLSDLVTVDGYKAILRHFHAAAAGEPSAFLDSLARTLLQVAKYQVALSPEELVVLKRLKSKLKPVPFDLTSKNKALLSQLQSDKLRAKLMFLPEKLVERVAVDLKSDRVSFVKAQIAVAVAILLSVPLRSDNLWSLEWRHHFSEPDGFRGRLIIHIPARETKTRRSDYIAEVPSESAGIIRWYRTKILPSLTADAKGHLFVTKEGTRKSQNTLSQQLIEAIADHVGVHMTPHQFRHFAATLYLEDRPDDFETVRNLLGHAWAKTTSIYAGSGSRRASRAYGEILVEQRKALRGRTAVQTLSRRSSKR